MFWRSYLVVNAAVLCLALAPLIRAGQTGDEQRARILALFNMNDLEKRADGTTQATKPTGNGAPQVRLVGGSVVEDGQSGVEFIDAEEGEHPAGSAAAWSSGINDNPPNALLLGFETPRRLALTARFDLRSTRTGSPAMKLQYRTGGSGDFKTLVAKREITTDSRFHEVRFDLTKKAPELLNARRVELLWIFAPGTGGNGTTRVDNLQVLGTAPGR